MDILSQSFDLFFNAYNFLALFAGVIIGVIVGAIPGMTTPMGVALTLPFTFNMSPVTGILMLLGVYKGGLYGGSITAILIKTPGTPAASCTVLDGFPMAQRGEARRALDMALYASCFADLISNLSLILFSGSLASLALQFGPPEMFTLIFFSLTTIAGVSGESLPRGVLSACLGLIAAVVGLDIIYGSERLVFGSTELMGGLDFIPVLIGLFALPEMFAHYTRKAGMGTSASPLQGIGATFKDFRNCFKSILRGSIIGVILGAIPGIGGAPSAFLSYSEAKRNSKNAANFGKGEIEGVAASESGNNGVAGATLIPLLALGVPGDVITAVILGAFMIHGLKPGPLLFTQNLPMIYALFMGIMFSSIALLAVGKVAIKGLSKIADISYDILYPAVFVMCAFGAYAVNNNAFDILVMLCMGVVGYIMLLGRIPAAPFLIAYILGPMLEDSFRQSLLLSGGSFGIFLKGGICWTFWGLSALLAFLLIRSHSKKSRQCQSQCTSC